MNSSLMNARGAQIRELRSGSSDRGAQIRELSATSRRLKALARSVRASRPTAGGRGVPGLAALIGRALGDSERVAASAGCDGVRVVDLEARLLNRVQEVDGRAAEVRRTERIDDNPH